MNMKKISTPWGLTHWIKKIDTDGLIIKVGTAEHGGYGVHQSLPMPEALAVDSDGEWRWYEEDEAWCAVVMAFPAYFEPHVIKDALINALIYFPAMCQKYLVAPARMQHFTPLTPWLKHLDLPNHFTPSTAYGDWAWDVPDGHIFVWGRRGLERKGFLVPFEDYHYTVPIVLDRYPQWEPDQTLPLTKPDRQAVALKKAA